MNEAEWLQIYCKGGFRGTLKVVEQLEAGSAQRLIRITELKHENGLLREEFERRAIQLNCLRIGYRLSRAKYREARAENEHLREAIDSAIETWDSNAPGRGLTERQALRKLHAVSNNG